MRLRNSHGTERKAKVECGDRRQLKTGKGPGNWVGIAMASDRFPRPSPAVTAPSVKRRHLSKFGLRGRPRAPSALHLARSAAHSHINGATAPAGPHRHRLSAERSA